jgi:hypothetical protein
MKEIEPLMMLEGRWTGKGKGSYGPFSAEMEVEVRGRWLLMTQQIKVPIVGITTYVSTQVYGYDDAGLTLDFFDTAGAFNFHGFREGDQLTFHFKDDTVEKISLYRKVDDGISFDYTSTEIQEDGSGKEVHFEGVWKRAE